MLLTTPVNTSRSLHQNRVARARPGLISSPSRSISIKKQAGQVPQAGRFDRLPDQAAAGLHQHLDQVLAARLAQLFEQLLAFGQQPSDRTQQIDDADQRYGNPDLADFEQPHRGMPCWIIRPLTTRFVDVPISVQVPPRIARYESGISSFEGETLVSPAPVDRRSA